MISQPLENVVYNSLPAQIRASIETVMDGNPEAFLNAPPEPPSVRINTLRSSINDMQRRFKQLGIDFTSHPFNPTGLILKATGVRYTHTLEYFTGKVHGQGVSSQIPVLALDPQPGQAVLDMAASPGSKSTQIAAMMKNRGKLLLCDPSPKRQQALLTNMARAGIINDVYLQMPGQRMGRLFHESFDRVLLDSPCSAMSKLPGQQVRAQWVWTERAFQTLLNTQYPLLVSAIKAAKPGGTIVYSTCTLTIEENEALLDRVLREYPVELVDISWLHGPAIRHGMTGYQGDNYHPDLAKSRRIIPGPEAMEAFFLAKLVKTDSVTLKGWRREPELLHLTSVDDPRIREVLDYISNQWGVPGDLWAQYRYYRTQKKLWLCAPDWESFPAEMFVKAGLALAVQKSNQWKLTTAGACFLGNSVTTGVIELEEKELINLFKQGKIAFDGVKNGYYALKFKTEIMGAVSVMAGSMKINLPHRFDLII